MTDLLASAGLDIQWPAFTALIAGTAFGFVAGLVPGIGGRVGLILAIPFALSFEPLSGAIFLVAMHAVVHTSGSIPSIAYGMPTSAADAATVQDGFPLARAGKAGLALGASLTASAVGGLLGAAVFLLSVPFARPLISSFGPPEMLLLGLIGVSLVAALSQQGLLQGLAGGALGMLVATIGLEPFTTTPRYTFGLLELWDGPSLAAVVGGLFVVPELLERQDEQARRIEGSAASTRFLTIAKGMLAALSHWRVVAVSSIYGIVIGLMPGVGASVACWLAYAHTARSVKSDVPYGQGALAGVIAPESANNSKEGGAMIPTFFFGIPGSSSMAIMLGAFTMIGVRPHSDLLTNTGFVYKLGWTVILANLLAVPLFLLLTPWLVRFTALKRHAIAPIAVAASVTAALVTSPSWITLPQFALAALIGIAFKRADWPRAPILLGFIIGPLLEISLGKTIAIWGFGAFERIPFLVLIALTAIFFMRAGRQITLWPEKVPKADSILVASVLAAVFVAADIIAFGFSGGSQWFPLAACTGGALVCMAIGAIAANRGHGVAEETNGGRILAVMAFLGAAYLVGIVPASVAFIVLYGRLEPRLSWRSLAVSGIVLIFVQIVVIELTVGFSSQPIFAGVLMRGVLGL